MKSSRSGNDDCVEVAWFGGGRVGVRDSKNPVGPALLFTSEDWVAFTDALRDGHI
ncbi:DUF397 domain-containing protein [Nocardia sp. NPDC001965]